MKGLTIIKYPVNVSPHMISIDATKQQSFSFDFYGEKLCGVECYLYDAVTNEHLMTYYGFGKNDNNLIVEEENANTLNMERCGYNFGQLGTSSYVLVNNRKYKYYLVIAQERINQFVFQGGINGIINNQTLIVVANSLLHSPREYSNDFMTFGYYLAMDIGNERRNIVNSIDNYDGTYTIILDNSFNQTLSIGTQYRVYSNYIKSPEYVFKTRQNPTLEILELDQKYMCKGGSAWFCKFNQENGDLIKSYNWTLEDVTSNSNILYSGKVVQPSEKSQYITKKVSTKETITTSTNKEYVISNINSIIEQDFENDNKLYLRIIWSDLIQSSALKDAKGNYVYLSGTKDHIFGADDCIKLTYKDFYKRKDSGLDEEICYINDFTLDQTITASYYDTFGNKLGECVLNQNSISSKTYDFSISEVGQSNVASVSNICIVKITNISNELQEKQLSICVQNTNYTSFIEDRYYYIGGNQSLSVSWTINEVLSSDNDDNYTSGYVLDTRTIYVDNKDMTNIVGKYFVVHDINIDGNQRLISAYDSSEGKIILNSDYYKYPSEDATFSILNNEPSILIQTNDFYKINTFYRNNYLAIDKTIKGTIECRTENDNIFTSTKTISFPKSEKDNNGKLINILYYIDSNNNIIPDSKVEDYDKQIQFHYDINTSVFSFYWLFRQSYLNNNNSQSLSIYREEKERTQINLIYTNNFNTNTDSVVSYSDFLFANNNDYRYIIILQTTINSDTDSEPIYKYYKYVTDWFNFSCNSWVIIGLNKKEKQICSKDVYSIGDSWRLYANLDSGDITQNINTTIYDSYSKYPKVGKIGNDYISGTLSSMLGQIDCINDSFEDDIYKVNAWRKFINKYQTYILKSDKGDIWQVSISSNPITNYDEALNLYTTISFSYTQIGDIHDVYIE